MEVLIRTNENDLKNLLDIYIGEENARKLIYDVLSNNSTAVEWLFKFHLGHKYPTVPEKGAVGYINLDKYQGWSGDLDKYKESSYVQQGFLKVTVDHFKGLHQYDPLVVFAPEHVENGSKWNNVFNINCDAFIPEDELDLDSLF